LLHAFPQKGNVRTYFPIKNAASSAIYKECRLCFCGTHDKELTNPVA
jgi:hypothetical protein